MTIAQQYALIVLGHVAVAAVCALLTHWATQAETWLLIRADIRHRREAHRSPDCAPAGGAAADPPTSGGGTATTPSHVHAA